MRVERLSWNVRKVMVNYTLHVFRIECNIYEQKHFCDAESVKNVVILISDKINMVPNYLFLSHKILQSIHIT